MVPLMDLWLPIVLSAVFVFIASSLLHMVLQTHKADYQKLPNEEAVMQVLRDGNVGPGNYYFPHCNHADFKKPEVMERIKRGPIAMLNVIPSGPPNMGKFLGQWFFFCLFVGLFAAYVAGRTLAPGTPYLSVFRITSTVAFLGFSGAQISDSIWKGQRWSNTVRHLIDGLIYGLLTGGAFGWLWPR